MHLRNIAPKIMNNLLSRVAIPVLFSGFFASGCTLNSGKQPRQEITPLYSAASPEFRQSAGSLLGPNFVGGNKITTPTNGREIFPAMLVAIRSAKRSVNLETYVFIDGDVAKQFTDALVEASGRGV